MSDTFGKANRATPAATLEQEILDPNHPKNDREWWAADEITRLRTENEKLRTALKIANASLADIGVDDALVSIDAALTQENNNGSD